MFFVIFRRFLEFRYLKKNMKKKLLFSSAVGMSILALGYLALTTTPEKQYQPRETSKVEAEGAIKYLHMMRANQLTGEISEADVIAARQQLNKMTQSQADALSLNWDAKGPDNQGGRTRAFIIDRNNNNILYAAGVAGGIYKSSNAGLSWISISDDLDNMAVVTLTQAANGDLYAGTGENMYAYTPGIGSATSPGMTGGGIYKSTDAGTTWTSLSATVPPANNNGSAWSAVGSMGADPTNASRIYAGTSGGLRRSDDGGATWSNPIGQGGLATDLAVATDGSIWVNVGGRTFYSSNGDDNNWTEISKNVAGATDLPRSNGRQKYAISPQDPNVIYCVQTAGSALTALYRTGDRGATWEVIQEKTALFDPLCRTGASPGCQGTWDLLLGVSSTDKNHVFLGGITVWEWKRQTGWRKVDGFGPFYIHSDKHAIAFDPVNPNIIYMTTDGGIHKSSDGGYTWQDMNKNYITTQFYGIGIGHDRKIVGGTQDNGSWLLDGTGNTDKQGKVLGPVDNFSGDGGHSLISWLSSEQYFTEYQSGRMGRSENAGESFTSFWDNRMVANGGPGSNGFSGWMLPYYLDEKTNDPLSEDSVYFFANPSIRSEGFGNIDTLIGTLVKQQPAGEFDAASFTAVSGGKLITSDAQGNLSGDGYGKFDKNTGEYQVSFTGTTVAERIMSCDVNYASGSTLSMESNINGLPFKYTLSQGLNAGDSIKVQDPVQGVLVAGLTGGVWMTRMAFNWDDPTKWWKIANVSGTPQCVTMSSDGDYAWVGTESGRVYRIANINKGRSLNTADVAQGDTATVQVTYKQVASYGGRAVTDIAVDPNNNDRVAITVGNYGNSTYVYYSDDATAETPTFMSRQGNLPEFPVYAVTFDKANSSNLIIGTEYGVFSTENITSSSPTWTEENNGMPRIPVFTLIQYRTNDNSSDPSNPIMEGDIFAGTHGRGIYWSNTLQTSRPIGVEEKDPIVFEENNAQINVFPNPARDFTNVELALRKNSDVTIMVRDITGKLIKQIKLSKVTPGNKEIRINTADYASGSYIITVQFGETVKSGKLVVSK